MVRSIGRRGGGGGGFSVSGSSALLSPPYYTVYEATGGPAQVFSVDLDPTERAVVHRLQIEPRAGGIPANLTFDVYDTTNNEVVASTNDSDIGEPAPLGQSEKGVEVIGRLFNDTGGPVDLSLLPVIEVTTQ
jgi:hypothetical protein